MEQAKRTLNKVITLSYNGTQRGGVKMITVGLEKGDITTSFRLRKDTKKFSGNRKWKGGKEEGNAGGN